MNTTDMHIPSNRVRDIERYVHTELDGRYPDGANASLAYPVKFWPTWNPFGRLGIGLSGEYIQQASHADHHGGESVPVLRHPTLLPRGPQAQEQEIRLCLRQPAKKIRLPGNIPVFRDRPATPPSSTSAPVAAA